MPIVSSQFVSGIPQADGRVYIVERHTDHNGASYDHEYLADAGADVALVMALRAQNIGAEIDAREAAEQAASGFSIPLSKYQFRLRFTQAERLACDAFNAGFEAHPGLSEGQRAAIRTGLADFNAATSVQPQLALPILQLYEALGLIGPGRAAEIGAA